MKSKTLFKCISVVLSVGLLSSCGTQTTETAQTTHTTEVGTADTQTTQVRDLMPTGAMAQMVLLTLAPERLVALSSELSEEELSFLPAEIAALPVLGTIDGDMGTAQVEELMLCNPTYIVDVGTTTDATLDSLAALTALTGIETIHASASVATMADVYLQLGEALGVEERAQTLATYCQEVYDSVYAQATAIPEDERYSVLYTQGDTGLYVLSRDSSHSELIDLWSNNVAVLEVPTKKGLGDAVDMEQILTWNPEVIFFGPDSIYDTVGEDPLWQSITAIQTGQYYQVPSLPYNWLGMPASINTYLGLQWVGSVLYPEEGVDFYATMAEFMALFYQYQLTPEAYLDVIE